LDFQREFYACLAIVAKYKQSIYNFSSKIWYFLHWNRLKTTKNSGGNNKDNFDVSSEGALTCTVSVCIHRTYLYW
jgi:hypothetical protein